MVSYSTNEPIGSADAVELPLFVQIARAIENDIVDGILAEGAQAPSTTEIAAFHRINPATALKGINQLVAEGILHKRRGIGMFVTPGARNALLGRRRADFAARFLAPALAEAHRLGLTDADVIALIQEAHHG